MTNPKIEKIDAAIAKLKAKISDANAKLRELERERVRLENNDIISLFRRENLTDADIVELKLIKASRSASAATAAESEEKL